MKQRQSRFLSIFLAIVTYQCRAYQPIGRWGHHGAVTNSGLYVFGGKTDPYNSFSYTSAPDSNDLLFLPLGSAFHSTSPPWTLLTSSSTSSKVSAPAVAWHTLSTINDSCFLLFGGLPDANSATQSLGLADSAYFLNLEDGNQPSWVLGTQSWANEPARRIRHSASSSQSLIFVVGGEKADGSGNTYSDNYIFDAKSNSFSTIPSTTGPTGIFDHGSVVLTDGRLLVLGGYSQPQSSLVPFSSIWSLDTHNPSPTWSLAQTSNLSLPTPRRAFATTLLYNGNVLIHGGSDEALQQNYADGWILDTSADPMIWAEVGTLSQIGPRRDHFAVGSGSQVLIGFGYTNSGPAPPNLYIYDVIHDAFIATYTPSTSISTTSQQSSSTPTGNGRSDTLSHPSQTGSGISTSPPSNSPGAIGSDAGSQHSRNTALAILFSVLGAIAVVFVVYYMRRRHLRRGINRQFVSLADDDVDGGSARSHSIPAVVMIDEVPHPERRSRFRLFNSWGRLSGSGTRHLQATRRRDMLGDEDAYDREWYHLKRTRDAQRSSWSFSSFVSNHLRGQESTNTTNGSIKSHKCDVSDPFADVHEEAGLLNHKPLTQRIPARHAPPGPDPFVDPIKYEGEGVGPPDEDSTFNLPPTKPPYSTFSPQLTATPSSLPSPTSQSSFPVEGQGSVSRNAHTSSASPYATSLINANRGPAQPISRSDSWWKRFARHSFLDHKLSNTSRKSPSMDLKEHSVPLMSIEEQADTLALKAVSRRSVEIVDNHPKVQSVSNFYEGPQHGKSYSSFNTADTEAIERIGHATVVVQRVRTNSNYSSSSSTEAVSFDRQQSTSKLDGIENLSMPDSLTQESLSQTDQSNEELSDGIATDSAASTQMKAGQAVAVRGRAYERRQFQDNEASRKARKDEDGIKVKYGLAPRESLFVVNPDKS